MLACVTFADGMAAGAIGLGDGATLSHCIEASSALATDTKERTANTSEVAPTLKSCIMAIPALCIEFCVSRATWHLALLVCRENQPACTR